MLILRPDQDRLVKHIERLMLANNKNIMLVEAGTGFGKTFSYLYPVLKLQSHQCIISTNSKNLQLQLLSKDIPFIKDELSSDFTYDVLYGKSNYICKHAVNNEDLVKTLSVDDIKIYSKIKKLNKGLLFKNYFKSMKKVPASFISLFSSSGKGKSCGKCKYHTCPFAKLNNLNLNIADVTVVNHNLLIHNYLQWLDDTSTASPLTNKIVIFDEAHSLDNILNEALREDYGTLKLYSVLRLINDLMTPISTLETKYTHLFNNKKLPNDFSNLYVELLGVAKSTHKDPTFRNLGSDMVPYFQHSTIDTMFDLLMQIKETLIQYFDLLSAGLLDKKFKAEYIKLQIDYNKNVMITKLNEGIRVLRILTSPSLSNEVDKLVRYYTYSHGQLSFGYVDLDFDFESFSEYLRSAKLLVFMSATLRTENTFDFFKTRMKITSKNYPGFNLYQCTYPSPFDYNVQMKIQVKNNNNGDLETLSTIINDEPKSSLLLFTARKTMEKYYEYLQDKVNKPIFTQDDSNLEMLLLLNEKENIVVLALASYWEGVDFKDLGIVYINKLYFDNPSNLVLQKKSDLLKLENIDPFSEYSVPRMITKMLQGTGRLIRNESNKGRVLINDNRVVTAFYGNKLVQSLPTKIEVVDKFN